MFLIAKAHLVSVLKNDVGIPIVYETQGNYRAHREARVFSIPNRSVTAQNFDNRSEIVEKYRDPTDLNTLGEPKVKVRILKADFTTTFLVQLTHKTPEELNTDFKNFFRNVGKFIYDGQTATRLDERDNTVVDSKGNKIHITFGNVNFNDNQFYKELKNWIGLEITFAGGIFLVPDPTAAEIILPDPKINVDKVEIP